MSTIYIVEDDRNISEIESFSLKNSGYEIESVTNKGYRLISSPDTIFAEEITKRLETYLWNQA